MNRDEILAMKPGRDLDALVADKVMNWEWNDEKTFTQGNFIKVEPPYAFDHESGEPHFNWSPSTDISAAWEVFEWLIRKHDDATLTYPWCVAANYNPMADETWGIHVDGDSAPEAICKAALWAVIEE